MSHQYLILSVLNEAEITATQFRISKDVTGIPPETLINCTKLTNLIIEDEVFTLSNIGVSAYPTNCKINGEEALLSDSITNSNTTLQKLVIPYGTETLSNNQFANKTSLNFVAFPPTITKIGNSVFSGCTSLISIHGNFENVLSAEKSFIGCSNLKKFIGHMPNVKNTFQMFNGCSNLTSFTGNTPNLVNDIDNNASSPKNGMFNNCSALTIFEGDLSKLKHSFNMFFNCRKLSEFSCKSLSSLENGYQMFCCDTTILTSDLPDGLTSNAHLKSFNYDMDNLISAERMFHGQTSLIQFKSKMPSLVYAEGMFKDAQQLTSFTSNISNLKDGTQMFWKCRLETFTSPLPNLENGNEMFLHCNLDSDSVNTILISLPTRTNNPILTLGVSESGLARFNAITNSTFATSGTVTYKGWNITASIRTI